MMTPMMMQWCTVYPYYLGYVVFGCTFYVHTCRHTMCAYGHVVRYVISLIIHMCTSACAHLIQKQGEGGASKPPIPIVHHHHTCAMSIQSAPHMLLQMLRAPPVTVSNSKDAARGSVIRMPMVLPGLTDDAALLKQEAARAKEAAALGWLQVCAWLGCLGCVWGVCLGCCVCFCREGSISRKGHSIMWWMQGVW